MHPLFFIGLAITAAGIIASSNKKAPTKTTRGKDGVAPDNSTKTLKECGDVEVLDKDTLGDNRQEMKLLNSPLANPPPGFDGIDREDFMQFYREDPHAVLDPIAGIATKISRSFKKKGNSAKADAWWKYAEYLRDPDKGGNRNGAD